MSDQLIFVGVKAVVERAVPDLPDLDSPLRHKILIDEVVQSLEREKLDTATAQPNVDELFQFFTDAQKKASTIDWDNLTQYLPPPAKEEDLEVIEDVIERSKRYIRNVDRLPGLLDANKTMVRYHLRNLAHCLHTCFLLKHDRANCEDAVEYARRGIVVAEADEAEGASETFSEQLADLGAYLRSRFEYSGQLVDLDEAVIYSRRSVSVVPAGAAARKAYSIRLGELLWRRFEITGSTLDVTDAIEAQTGDAPIQV